MAVCPAPIEGTTGYAHPDYSVSLSEFGDPLLLPHCDGWLLRRKIDGSQDADAMGPYPLFFCRHWTALGDDLAALAENVVSVVLVADPFVDGDVLAAAAFDRVVHFKDHYVAELDAAPERYVHRSHKVNARRALRSVHVEVCDRPWENLEDWNRLYADLVQRKGISGMRAFSPWAFERQLRIPGLVMFKATLGDELVGLDLWYVQGDVAFGHLVAFSDEGYRCDASYATKWTMLEYFTGKVRWADLSGSAGLTAAVDDGLAVFKRGWSTGTRPVHLCGRVLQHDAYERLTRTHGPSGVGYFPAYRAGEFG